ncbi:MULTISPECIES: hypothetical protein [Methylosinus]|uniref:Uncharacterized protein n=1 Tax=Methylosinus trichosporium (strain ATCC 35070 / NCIMB 11131 / UNIQEM 75 / OB3b) TaxID=595536 RepID=A0A2D2D386_METT3|nr:MULTISPECIES: hypothetical protein [Methylosinus]ATQ69416.1 hypothetical protein CQW49_17125 [Methylosinus trichosporium OB3b]OBS52925.1 hypothetical protein A8B73_08535 [Methylosinus sp. 3S-1]
METGGFAAGAPRNYRLRPKSNGLERKTTGPSVVSSNARSDIEREERMALQVHTGGDLGNTIFWISAAVAFVAIMLSKGPA